MSQLMCAYVCLKKVIIRAMDMIRKEMESGVSYNTNSTTANSYKPPQTCDVSFVNNLFILHIDSGIICNESSQ